MIHIIATIVINIPQFMCEDLFIILNIETKNIIKYIMLED